MPCRRRHTLGGKELEDWYLKQPLKSASRKLLVAADRSFLNYGVARLTKYGFVYASNEERDAEPEAKEELLVLTPDKSED